MANQTITKIKGNCYQIGINHIHLLNNKDFQTIKSDAGFIVVLAEKYETVRHGVLQRFYLFTEQENLWGEYFIQGNASEPSCIEVLQTVFEPFAELEN